jgi:uncharacterized protein YqjF (DUF2071 family)
MNGKELLEALQQLETWELERWDLFVGTEDGLVYTITDVEIDKDSEAVVVKVLEE